MEEESLQKLFNGLRSHLNEKARRMFAGAAVKACGPDSVSFVSRTLGLARNTVLAGLRQIDEVEVQPDRVRAPGGGRKRAIVLDSGLMAALESLVDPSARGDPESPLRWTSKSTYKLAQELKRMGHPVSPRTVATLLYQLNYSLQSNRKQHEGGCHPDRDAQFNHINKCVKIFHADGQPVISVDAKKKELVGNFKNGGKEWSETGKPTEVNVYDFPDLGKGRATPFGVYDIFRNEGWVSVGIDHDTAEFAVESIRRWWKDMGRKAYSGAKRLLITADGGGSNGSRIRLWKTELQRFADEFAMEISVCHYPPGTSKWNKIEHRMFSFISKNWRGRPLESYSTMVNLIGNTTTSKGLKVKCRLDEGTYPLGKKVEDSEMDRLILHREDFHGEWNYKIKPRKSKRKKHTLV